MDQPEQLRLKRLFWAGPLTVAASVVAVLFIRMIAVAILKPPATFQPLTVGPPIFDTVVAATIAVFVFIANARYSLEPVRDYRAIAAKVLVVSFVPDVHRQAAGVRLRSILAGIHAKTGSDRIRLDRVRLPTSRT